MLLQDRLQTPMPEDWGPIPSQLSSMMGTPDLDLNTAETLSQDLTSLFRTDGVDENDLHQWLEQAALETSPSTRQDLCERQSPDRTSSTSVHVEVPTRSSSPGTLEAEVQNPLELDEVTSSLLLEFCKSIAPVKSVNWSNKPRSFYRIRHPVRLACVDHHLSRWKSPRGGRTLPRHDGPV